MIDVGKRIIKTGNRSQYPTRKSIRNNSQPHMIGIEWGAYNSFYRNRSMYDILNRGAGNIDLAYMKMMYHRSGTLLTGGVKEIVAGYSKGEWGEIPASNSANATVTIMKASDGFFAHCVGPARRGLTPLSAKLFAHPMVHETNAFWELKLEDSPEAMVAYARDRAHAYLGEAEALFARLDRRDPAYDSVGRLLKAARTELEAGDAANTEAGDTVAGLARLARAYTRAQVRARQAINALVPPAASPEDLAGDDSD
jgi:hypothetical protein